MSNDPVGALEHLSTPNGIHGFNRYAYANNNPYGNVDPDGKESIPVSVVWDVSARQMGFANFSHLERSVNDAASQIKSGVNEVAGSIALAATLGAVASLQSDLTEPLARPLGLVALAASAVELATSENIGADAGLKTVERSFGKKAEATMKLAKASKKVVKTVRATTETVVGEALNMATGGDAGISATFKDTKSKSSNKCNNNNCGPVDR